MALQRTNWNCWLWCDLIKTKSCVHVLFQCAASLHRMPHFFSLACRQHCLLSFFFIDANTASLKLQGDGILHCSASSETRSLNNVRSKCSSQIPAFCKLSRTVFFCLNVKRARYMWNCFFTHLRSLLTATQTIIVTYYIHVTYYIQTMLNLIAALAAIWKAWRVIIVFTIVINIEIESMF